MLSVCQNQPLAAKEQALFKQLIKHYEAKQTKKGLKIADQILKKYPNHGETLAMKGLLTMNLGPEKREEAYELVRQGVKSDLKSHVCWHAYGLLYRGDRDYKEAIKCYMNALRLDKDNMMIMRDLSVLQIQTRDLQGFVETRQRILDLKPSNRNNWISFALAHHANRSFEVAVQVLDAYKKTLSEEIPANEAYEHSELILYKAMVLEEGGRLEDALHTLDSEKGMIRDHRGMMEMRAAILMKAGRLQEAEQQYRALLQANPDHYRYHEGLQAAMGLRPEVPAAESSATAAVVAATALSDDQRARLTALYADLIATYPRSSSCRRILLDFLQGDAFLATADAYVRKYLLRGVPSLFMDLRPLYRDPAKASALETLFTGFHEHMSHHQTLPEPRPLPAGCPAQPEQPIRGESPQEVQVWVLVYLAQHFDHLGQTTKGLELLDKAIQKAPSLIELFTTRARLLKHAGDYEGAAHSAETARRMDLSDRYLNSIAVKALFAAGKPEEASKTAALFTKDGVQLSLLHDMQHMWYECAAGTAYLKRKEWGKALKQFTTVITHFKDIEEDQFDFHNYCMRKTTLRAYVDTLRMEDRLFGHPFYARAAQGAVTAYLALYDAPSSTQTEANEEALMAGMSSEDRKKYKLKKKKEEKQKSKDEEEARSNAAAGKDQANKPGDKGKKGDKKEADPDPDGAKLASTPEPLKEASKLVASLKEHAAGLLETQLLALQVYLRKGKMLLALSAAQRAAAIAGPQHPQVHLAIVRFCSRAQSTPAPDTPAPHPEVASLIKAGQEKLLSSKHATSVKAYNDEWLATHCQDNSSRGDTLAARQAGAEALLVLAGAGQVSLADAKAQAAKLLTSATPLSGIVTKRRHEQCVAITKLLEEDIADAAAAKKWREICSQSFPFSRFFGGSRIVQLESGLLDMTNMTKAFGYLSFQ